MAASEAQVTRLRRMVAEPSTATYSDADLAEYIERHPLLDALGNDPYQVSATSPFVQEENPDWSGTDYDLNAAAADCWDEKAAALAAKFAFTTDGQTFNRQQQFEQAQKMARYYRSRQSARTVKLWPWPAAEAVETIANLAESDD